jgi:starch-binding outer membrane protein, SusD/RagB family
MKTTIIIYRNIKLLIVLLFIIPTSCSDKFLEEKPNSSLVVPGTLEDCQLILDNNSVMTSDLPSLGLLGSDEYFVTKETWQASRVIERNAYVWADEIYEGETNISEWNSSFKAIFACNAVLQVLESIPVTIENERQWKNIKATALFYRAYRYFALTEVFTLPYLSSDSENTLGLPLRSSADVDYTVQRSSLADTFDFIIKGLNEAITLFNIEVPDERLNRPTLATAYGALARIHLILGRYDVALENAEQCLLLYNKLLDYNTVSQTTDYPFENNPEILFSAIRINYPNLNPYPRSNTSFVDTALYRLYDNDDLRRICFFHGPSGSLVHRKYLYSHDGRRVQNFAGVATNEIYLIKSECLVRLNRVSEAMDTLNLLLLQRYKKDTYRRQQAFSQDEALQIVLSERRKELVFQGARWSDVRRLNLEGFDISMYRLLNGQNYQIDPNTLKYAFPIPESEITLGNLIQNPR